MNASEYSTPGKQLCPNIHIEFIPKEDIAQQTTFLDAKELYLEPTTFTVVELMAATKSKYQIQPMTLMFVMSDTNDYLSRISG